MLRITPSATGAGYEACHIAFLQRIASGFAHRNRFATIGEPDLDRVRRAIASAVDAPRREFVPAEGAGYEPALIAEDTVIAYQALSAPIFALSALGDIELVPIDLNPINRFR